MVVVVQPVREGIVTPESLAAGCAQIRRELKLIGMDPESARMTLVIKGLRYRRTANVLPGVRGDVVGRLEKETIVSVAVVAIERYLRRIGALPPLHPRPFVHLWWQRPHDAWPWCRVCGRVRVAGRMITGCTGNPGLSLRR